MNINEILICPACKSDLHKSLKCVHCDNVYSSKSDIYNILSHSLSGIQAKISMKRKLANLIKKTFIKKFEQKYISRLSAETRQVMRKQMDCMSEIYSSFSGMVCDFPTGIGRNLKILLDNNPNNATIVCTDIDADMLSIARKHKGGKNPNTHYVITDGRYMSFKDDIFDYIASIAAFGNVTETGKMINELYRILKPQGKIVMNTSYIEKGSKSYELAKSAGLERGMVEEYLLKELADAGFINISSTIIGKAIWAENPYDLLPVAGDMQYFCIVQAEKNK
ncbi:MAG: class I SAM-dependent methyltransferase [Defluviitaleaceae bacterium]|nr:class I SAM-dependent methyltransferase [Defluviitaleaceae bacterium]